MKSEHNRYLGLCLPYALGRLNPRNRNFFENHLKSGCEDCNKELAEIYEAMSLLPLSLPPQAVPSHIRYKVMAAVQSGGRAAKQVEQRTQKLTAETPAQPRPWFGYAVAFASLVVVVALGLYTNSLIDRIDTQDQRIVALTNELRAKEELLNVLQAPRIDMVFMNGLEPSPTGYGKIIWDPVKKVAIFQVANLP
ncbi:MAG: hypothetical protein ACRDGA_09655, partial [Bacteroidota bacterium]